jgi:hypothetical protein
MDINEDTIGFKSVPELYLKEKYGKKPNTVRHFSGREKAVFEEYRNSLKTIVITNSDTGEYFERELTDISSIGIGGKECFIFSWLAFGFIGAGGIK